MKVEINVRRHEFPLRYLHVNARWLKYYNAWITAIWEDEIALQAIVLAQSLRKVVTHGKIVAVIPSKGISDCVRDLIVDNFDILQELDINSFNKNGFSFLEAAKIFSWKFYWWKKCIFLNPDCIVLKNCDDIFENKPDLLFPDSELISATENYEPSFFVFEPSYQVYKDLIELLRTKKFQKVADLIISRCQGWSILPSKYLTIVKPTAECNEIRDTKILSLSQTCPWTAIQQNDRQIPNEIDTLSREWLVVFFKNILNNLSVEQLMALKVDSKKTSVLGKQFVPRIPKTISLKQVHNYLQDSIAIIGYSCRFPAANNGYELWELLKSGGDGISQIPLERLNESQLEDPRLTAVKAGYLKCPIDEFDAKFFGISPREAVFMDPQQRLLVEVAWEALENSGINPHSLKGSNTGVFTGVWTHEYETLLTDGATGAEFNHVVLGNAYSATSARVSYLLGLNGPNIATESGCSSSMVSLHLACQSLRRDETQLVLVGGVNLLCKSFDYSQVSILAKDGHCKTFDAKADGFARGEGVGVLVLKKYADAVKDGDRVMAIVRGTGISNEGTTNSFGTPSKHCQLIAIKEAIKDSRVNPLLVDYVEAHGTGTPIGDPIEFSAIAEGYSGKRDKPLVVGSIKTNIGHSESAAGLAGILKVIMAMENELIPQHRNLKNLNPNIDLDSVPAIIPTEPIPWPKNTDTIRFAGVSSFGISGTNVHVILQEPPHLARNDSEIPPEGVLDRQHGLLTLSAKSDIALKELVEKYISYFAKQPRVNLKDVVFTANNSRAHFKNRLAVVGQTVGEMKSNLEKGIYSSGCIKPSFKPVVAFLFTGQGSQYFGMARNLYETNKVFKTSLDCCSLILRNNHRLSLFDILWNDDSNSIDETRHSQIAIFCVEYGLLKLWESLGIKPDVVMGHSVGEFAAATAAGVLSFQEALILVAERSRLIHNLSPGGMVVVRAPVEQVQNKIQEFLQENPNCWLDIAVINSSHEVVVAGKESSLCEFSEFLRNCVNIKSQRLAASHAFHSRDMELILEDFGNIAKNMNYKAPKCNYISGSTGKQLQKDDFNFEYWQKHARYCVDFVSSVKSLENHGCNIFVEIGAHPILLALTMNNLSSNQSSGDQQEKLWLPSIRKFESEWVTLLSSLGKLYVHGFDIDWKRINCASGRNKIELPTYPFQRQKYWLSENNSVKVITLNNKLLHPMLGSKIPYAGNEHVYQNSLSLQNLPYLKDHQVANIIILPGAGFLEIILAAGKDVFQSLGKDSKDELFVTDFMIDAALELEEHSNSTVQTVASIDKGKDFAEVKIFLHCNMNGYNDEKGWKCYASAKVSLNPLNIESLVSEKSEFGKIKCSDTTLDLQSVKSRCTFETSTEEYYKKIPEVGISFGKAFQSVSKVWKGENEALTLIPIPENSGIIQNYIYHPIVLDAMIQSYGITLTMEGTSKRELFLPIGIDNFQMLQQNNTSFMHAHVSWDKDTKNGHVGLYDEFGKSLAFMKGVRLVKTSLTSFLNAINASKNQLPGIYTEIVRSRDGPLQNRVTMTKLLNGKEISAQIKQQQPKIENTGLKENDQIGYLEVLKTFIKLEWRPVIGKVFTAKQFMTDLIISPSHEQLVERMLEILCEEEILQSTYEETGNVEYTVINKVPSIEVLEREIDKLYKIIEKGHAERGEPNITLIFKHCAAHMAETLLGNETGVSTLFSGEIDPFVLYSAGQEQKIMNIHIAEYISKVYENLKQESSDHVFRILEVGAGTGVTCSHVVSILHKRGIPFRYTFTDIGQHFLEEAKIKFKDFSGFEYRLLNIEKDPKLQGFSPYQYDVVIASNVIHATSYITESVQNIRHLMVPSGILCLIEILRPVRYIDLTFGVLEGYWCFKDYDLRPSHAVIDLQKWNSVLNESQFQDFDCQYPESHLSLLLSRATDSVYTSLVMKLKEKINCFVIFDDGGCTGKFLEQNIISMGGSVVKIYQTHQKITMPPEKDSRIFNVDPNNQEEFSKIFQKISSEFTIHSVVYLWSLIGDTKEQERISLGLLQIFKAIISLQISPKILVVTRGIKYIGDQKTVNYATGTLEGMVYSYMNEAHNVSSLLIDLDPDVRNAEEESREIFYELWTDNEERCFAFRNKKKHVFRMNHFEKTTAPLRIPSQQRYCLTIPSTKNLNDVAYKLVSKSVLLPNEVEVSVRATALNFRDILVILKPEQYHTLFDAVGTDFSGIVTDVGSNVKKFKTGEKIFGISNVTSIASHVVVPEDFIMTKPKEFTFADASTLPSVFLTAYYCLFNVAGLMKNETILIHVASGGVGLVAIQLAKKIGANIIATAGSNRKRAYLRSIGIKHVFHSRDISYGDEIEKVTGGKGVDMVLNSLTGVNFKETSLRVCAKNARFVEMGKVNIWQPQDVEKLRADVKYTIVDLEKVEKHEMRDLMLEMDKLFSSGLIEPLPYTRFDGSQIKEALNYFLKAQHIGKIVVSMPQFCNNNRKQFTNDVLFDSESTYLITGALGGIGLEVVKWMVISGARNLVLVGRNPPDEKATEVIRNVKSKGCHVLTFQVDVGNWDQCKNLFHSMTDKRLNLPQLRGVIHSAGALSDGFIKDQSWEKFQVTYNAKVNGGWNLHELTRNMRLEHFVLFSSAAGTIGAPAQINHASANTFLNSLAHLRYSLGLPTHTIVWGAWSDIGAATNSVYGKEGAFGAKPFTPVQGIASLKFAMSRPCTQVMVVQFDAHSAVSYLPSLTNYLEEITVENEIATTSQGQEIEMFWSEISVLNLEERTLYMKRFLEALIRKTLRLPDSEQVDEHQTYSEMGLDSLMAMEMRNKMQHLFGKYLTIKPTSLLDYPNLAGLSRYLAELTTTVDFKSIDSNQSNDEKLPTFTDDLQKLMQYDSILPNHIKCVNESVIAPSNITKILITGATGHVGVHFLGELAQKENVKIFCLLRAKTVDNGRKRLIAALKKFGLLSPLDLNKIKIVLGNVVQKNLGVAIEEYEKLCVEVDAIVHCAAKVNHVERYQKHKTSSDIRSVNTLGLIHVLELASTVKTKHVVYPGSVSSANEFTEKGYLSETLPAFKNTGEGINIGYGHSKLVCEKLIRQAIDRGIPCRVFRYATLTGNSQSGLFTLDTNLYMGLMLTFCQLEMIPKIENRWYTIPIDIAIELSCSLIFNDDVESGLYNLIPNETINMEDCNEVAEIVGAFPKLVSVAEFEEKVRSSNVGVSLGASYFSENESFVNSFLNSFPAFKLGIEQGKEVYCKSSKIEKYIPNFQELIPNPKMTTRKLVEYAKNSGMLATLGIGIKK